MKKPPIVILHGWGLSGQTFAPLSRELSKLGYASFAPDMPGFGEAPVPDHPFHLRDYATFLRAYVEKQGIQRPILLGHSFGGRVALQFTREYPENVSALILSGTPGFTPIPKRKLALFIALARIGKTFFSLPALSLFQGQVRRWYYYAVGAREFFRAEGSMRETFKNIVQEDLARAMESVTKPCLLLWGEYDVIVPVPIAERMHHVIQDSKLVIVPEADHGVPFKKPDVFAMYVNRFLTSV